MLVDVIEDRQQPPVIDVIEDRTPTFIDVIEDRSQPPGIDIVEQSGPAGPTVGPAGPPGLPGGNAYSPSTTEIHGAVAGRDSGGHPSGCGLGRRRHDDLRAGRRRLPRPGGYIPSRRQRR